MTPPNKDRQTCKEHVTGPAAFCRGKKMLSTSFAQYQSCLEMENNTNWTLGLTAVFSRQMLF